MSTEGYERVCLWSPPRCPAKKKYARSTLRHCPPVIARVSGATARTASGGVTDPAFCLLFARQLGNELFYITQADIGSRTRMMTAFCGSIVAPAWEWLPASRARMDADKRIFQTPRSNRGCCQDSAVWSRQWRSVAVFPRQYGSVANTVGCRFALNERR